jgi:hypothetical protein
MNYLKSALLSLSASLVLLVAVVVLLGINMLHAQSIRRTESVPARVLIGLPGIDPNTPGELIVGPSTVRFAAVQGGRAEILRHRILSVSVGDERIETGGTAGRIARILIPYGGGLALGAVTHKKVSLLTIEYLDSDGQYHGAVFLVSAEDLAGPLEPLQSSMNEWTSFSEPAQTACVAQNVQLNTVQLRAITADVTSAFPPEDRVLLYENIVKKLQAEKSVSTVYRAGRYSTNAPCAEFSVTVRAVAFKKGDQAVRASVGPLGHFVGTTRLAYHLTVVTNDGRPVMDEDLKASEGSDTDSLNITKVISKSVVKNLKKSRKRAHLSDAA